MPFLDLFFILAKLLFELVDDLVDGSHEVFRLVVGDEIVLMLGGDLKVDARLGFVGEIDNDFDSSEAVENPRQFFRLGGNFLLRSFAQLTMPGGNFDLHQPIPHCLVPGTQAAKRR